MGNPALLGLGRVFETVQRDTTNESNRLGSRLFRVAFSNDFLDSLLKCCLECLFSSQALQRLAVLQGYLMEEAFGKLPDRLGGVGLGANQHTVRLFTFSKRFADRTAKHILGYLVHEIICEAHTLHARQTDGLLHIYGGLLKTAQYDINNSPVAHFPQHFLKTVRRDTARGIKIFEKADVLHKEENHLFQKARVASGLVQNCRYLFRRQTGKLFAERL